MAVPTKTGLNVPRLPRPIGEVDREYVNQLVGMIELALEQLLQVGPAHHETLNISNLKSNGSGLRVDDVFEDGGILNIVRASHGYPAPLSATGSVGTVTVVTT